MKIYNGPRGLNSRLAYRVQAQAEDAVEILIYDEIGENWYGDGLTAERFAAELAAISASRIDVRINSVGGSVFEGNAIYNALRRHSARVETHIDGIAASIASIIALAGERVHIAENAFIMIHNPQGMAWGEATDMRKMADTLDTVRSSLVGTYAKKTGQEVSQIEAWMDEETWFGADEAKEYGFADEITDGIEIDARIAAAATMARFSNLPAELEEKIQAAMEPTAPPAPEPAALEPEAPATELLQLAAAVQFTLSETRL